MLLIFLLHALTSTAVSAQPCGLEVVGMRTNNLVNPLGIPLAKTKFSWGYRGASSSKNVVQSAYQIKVSSKGAGGAADLWDSGVVKTTESIQIEYAGKPFAPSQLKYVVAFIWYLILVVIPAPSAYIC